MQLLLPDSVTINIHPSAAAQSAKRSGRRRGVVPSVAADLVNLEVVETYLVDKKKPHVSTPAKLKKVIGYTVSLARGAGFNVESIVERGRATVVVHCPGISRSQAGNMMLTEFMNWGSISEMKVRDLFGSMITNMLEGEYAKKTADALSEGIRKIPRP